MASILPAFAESVYIFDGPTVRDMGLWLTTRMTVVRLSNGLVWVSSPVPSSLDTRQHILRLGPVDTWWPQPQACLRLAEWDTFFPQAQLWRLEHTVDAPEGTPALHQRPGERAPSRLVC